MGRILIFDYYFKDTLCTHCEVDFANQIINVKNYINDPLYQAFGLQTVTMDSIDEFFRERCFPETRVDCLSLCNYLGLDSFDAEEICRKTHGKCISDFFWIKFDNENIRFKELRGRIVILEKEGIEV